MFIEFTPVGDVGYKMMIHTSIITLLFITVIEGKNEVIAETEEESWFRIFRGDREQCERVYKTIVDGVASKTPVIKIHPESED